MKTKNIFNSIFQHASIVLHVLLWNPWNGRDVVGGWSEHEDEFKTIGYSIAKKNGLCGPCR